MEKIANFICKDCKKQFQKNIGKSEEVITTKGYGVFILDKKTNSTFHIICPNSHTRIKVS